MNILQIQERLNRLPPSPQTLQYLAAAAEGQNPNVPPWLALVRRSEINKEMQEAQKMQQPAQNEQPQGPPPTVKDQVQQATGVMALQQQKQQAGLQQLAQQAGQGQPAPGGIAGPPPPQMAQGGIAAVAPQAFRRGGGVRGFAGGDTVEGDPYFRMQGLMSEADRREKEERAAYEIQQENMRRLAERPVPVPPDPNEQARQQYQAMGVDPRASYDEQQRRLQELEKRIQQEDATRAQEQSQAGKMGFFNSLISAGEATRGARGSGLASLMGGYGRAQAASDEDLMKMRRESEGQMLNRRSNVDALRAGLDKSRMGTAEQFADRGTRYGELQATAQGAQNQNVLGVERDIGRQLGTYGTEATRSAGDVRERVASALGQRSTMASAERKAASDQIKVELQSTNQALTNIATQVQALEKNPEAIYGAKTGAPSPEAQRLLALREQQKEFEGRRKRLAEQLDALHTAMTQGATSTGGASGAPYSPDAGAPPPPNTAAARFRQNFPQSR